MALIPLPIGATPYYNVDEVSRNQFADTCVDGYIDESKTVRRRGALKPYADTETGLPGNGIFYWVQENCLIARSGTKAFKIEENGSMTEITGVTFNQENSRFSDGNTIDGSPWLYVFDGGYPVHINGATATRLGSATGSPANVNFGCWNTGRFLVADHGTRKFYATDTNPATGVIENDYFLAGANPLTAEQRPDNVDYIGTSWEEIQVWGRQGLETWRPDDTFFSPVIGTFSPTGILAPYSVVEANNTIFALCLVDNGQKRAVVNLQGRVPQVLSLPIEKILRSYAVVEDAVAWVTNNSEYIISFPTEGVTWCFDYRINAWYQWGHWNSNTATHEEFIGRFSASAWGKCFMQSRVDGKIYTYDRDTFQDDGDTLATEYRTGWITRPTRSRCNFLRLLLKRGQGDITGTEPILLVRWRDEGKKDWCTAKEISLGKIGEYEFYREIRLGSVYRSRQYSFIITDNADLALVGIWEDIYQLIR